MKLPPYIQKYLDLSTFNWYRLLLVLVILLIGVGLRLYALEDIYLWADETDWFDEEIYGEKSMSLRKYAALKASYHTVGPGWPIIVSLTCRAFGGKAAVARIPSVLFGAAAILAIFSLVYRVLQSHLRGSAFLPAFYAALLTAISILQLEFSQRTYPFAAIPALTTLIVILHLEMVRVIQSDKVSIGKFSIFAFLYTLVGGFSIFLHMSFSVVIGGSFLCFLVLVPRFLKLNRQDQVIIIGISALAVLGLFLAWVGNAIPLSQSGYRWYLSPYYHRLDFGAISFLLTRAYDVFTYHLNLFYNGILYWPRHLNPVLLPLVGLCIFGWIYAALGKFGQAAKYLSLLATGCMVLTAVLALLKKYPFGGVRQTIFMTPFLLSFTAIGFYTVVRSPKLKPIGVVVAVAYIILWMINLPHFYRERVQPFDSKELMTTWEQSGKLKVYTLGGSNESIRYRLRGQPRIEIKDLPWPRLPNEESFLLVSTHWSIEDELWRPKLKGEIESSGFVGTLLMNRLPKYPLKRDYIQSLYYPPNGLWVYKISMAENSGR
jgi:hypothetical protein